jgi:hypothetical protein
VFLKWRDQSDDKEGYDQHGDKGKGKDGGDQGGPEAVEELTAPDQAV